MGHVWLFGRGVGAQAKVVAVAVVVAAMVLLFDLSLPLGVAGGVPYVALVLIGIWLPKIEHIVLLALVGTVLTIAGYLLSPEGGIPWVVMTNRGLALFAIWITAALLVHIKNRQAQLCRNEEELQRYVQDLEMASANFEEQASDMARLAEELHAEKERVEESKRIIEHQAVHDPLTDLGNRALLNKALSDMLEYAEENGSRVGFIYIDLDNFKPVNDRLGHDAGDKLLCDVAKALRKTIGEKDTAIRQGGDEFAVLACLETGKGRADLKALAERILAALTIPVQGPDFVIETGASIGIALHPDDGADVDAILTAADNAMYEAKRAGKGRVS